MDYVHYDSLTHSVGHILPRVRISVQIRLIMSHSDNLRLMHGLHGLCVQARTLATRTARIVLATASVVTATQLLIVLLGRIPGHAATVHGIATALLVVVVHTVLGR